MSDGCGTFRPGLYPPWLPLVIRFCLFQILRVIVRGKFIVEKRKLPLKDNDFGLYLDIHVVSMLRLKKFPNLLNPSGYNDQIKWHMLFAQNELMPICADKVAARDFIEKYAGSEHLVPLVASTRNWDELVSHLTNGSGVLKCSHDSGSATFFSNLDEAEVERLRLRFAALIARPYGVGKGDWVYGVVEPSFLIEKILPGTGGSDVPDDFKVHCVKGEPRLIHIIRARQKSASQAFFLPDGSQVFPRVKPHRATISGLNIDETLPRALPVARKIAKFFEYVRIDLYVVDEQVYVGEISFFEESGLFAEPTEEQDLGNLIRMNCNDPKPTIHNALFAARES